MAKMCPMRNRVFPESSAGCHFARCMSFPLRMSGKHQNHEQARTNSPRDCSDVNFHRGSPRKRRKRERERTLDPAKLTLTSMKLQSNTASAFTAQSTTIECENRAMKKPMRHKCFHFPLDVMQTKRTANELYAAPKGKRTEQYRSHCRAAKWRRLRFSATATQHIRCPVHQTKMCVFFLVG